MNSPLEHRVEVFHRGWDIKPVIVIEMSGHRGVDPFPVRIHRITVG